MAKLLALIIINVIPKDIPFDIAFGLTHDEYKCKCDRKTCHYTLFSKKLADSYRGTRMHMGVPLYINSGYRCQEHNKGVGGVAESSHTTGNAIDISFNGLTDTQIKKLIARCKYHFSYVKVYKTFIHCQING